MTVPSGSPYVTVLGHRNGLWRNSSPLEFSAPEMHHYAEAAGLTYVSLTPEARVLLLQAVDSQDTGPVELVEVLRTSDGYAIQPARCWLYRGTAYEAAVGELSSDEVKALIVRHQREQAAIDRLALARQDAESHDLLLEAREAATVAARELDDEELADARALKAAARVLGLITEDKPRTRPHIPDNVKLFVWRRDQGACVDCGSRQALVYDHIIPFSKGGASTARNLQLLCESCNLKKGARIVRGAPD